MVFHSLPPFLPPSKSPSMLGVPEVYHVFHHGFRCPSETCLERYLDVTPWKLQTWKSGAHKECKHSNLCSIFSMHHVRRHGTNTVFCCKIFRSKEVVHVASTSPNKISLENLVLVSTNQPSKCCLPSPRYFPEGFNGIPIRIPEETLHTSEVRLVNYSLGSTSPRVHIHSGQEGSNTNELHKLHCYQGFTGGLIRLTV